MTHQKGISKNDINTVTTKKDEAGHRKYMA